MLPPPKRSPATEHPKGVVYRRVKKRKLLPGWAVFLIDFGLIGVTVCIFALFHHVLPRKSNNPGVVIPPPGVSSTVSDASGNPVSRPDTSGAPDTGGQFGAKFADKFSDTVQKTDSSYVSKDIRVTLTKHTTNRERNGRSYVVTYFVADIYIRNIENFRTAFAQGEYGHGYRDNTVTMAKDNNAVVALSGDYYSIRDTGVVIRNGMLYREQAFRDVCVLYRDGSMRTYSKETFDIFQGDLRYQRGGGRQRLAGVVLWPTAAGKRPAHDQRSVRYRRLQGESPLGARLLRAGTLCLCPGGRPAGGLFHRHDAGGAIPVVLRYGLSRGV